MFSEEFYHHLGFITSKEDVYSQDYTYILDTINVRVAELGMLLPEKSLQEH